jgi:hypothetical protein
MSEKFHMRSVSSKDNYANYLILPLLKLNKFSYGTENFINGFVTVNGKIAIHLKAINEDCHKHPNYLTDFTYNEGVLVLYSCPYEFEADLLQFMASKYSRMSDEAKQLIYEHSGLSVDFPNRHNCLVSSRLIQAIRRDERLRDHINKEYNTELGPEDEVEPLLREQDILYDIDSDIIAEEVHHGKEGHH